MYEQFGDVDRVWNGMSLLDCTNYCVSWTRPDVRGWYSGSESEKRKEGAAQAEDGALPDTGDMFAWGRRRWRLQECWRLDWTWEYTRIKIRIGHSRHREQFFYQIQITYK
jgi:hypothetical protein